MAKKRSPGPGTALDPEKVFILVQKFGGYAEAANHLAEKGVLNPRTQKPYSKHIVKYSARKAKGFERWKQKLEEGTAHVREQLDDIVAEIKEQS